MKRIGILGGMMPDSTSLLYQSIIKKYVNKFNNHSYPEIVIFSVNFDEIFTLQESNDLQKYAEALSKGLIALKDAGVDFAIIASNSPHVVFDELQNMVNLRMLSIVTATLNEAKKQDLKKVLLLGTRMTMRSNFYQKEFIKENIEIITPNDEEQEVIVHITDTELLEGGKIQEESKNKFVEIIKNYSVDGVILGCTDFPFLLKSKDIDLPMLDTTDILAEAALEFARTK